MQIPTHAPRILLLSAFGIGVNPYIGLLRDGLAAAGAEVRMTTALTRADLGVDRPDVIHLHWLERLRSAACDHGSRARGATDLPRRALRRGVELVANLSGVYALRRWRSLRRFIARLRAFQAAGGRVAYTVHNLDPHEDAGPVERWAAARMMRLADVIHVHDASTAEAVMARCGRTRGVAIVPHGHYLDTYPNTISRAEARNRLGVPPDVFVFVCLGLLRPYKGLEELLPAFRSLPDSDAYLVLAGKPGSDDYLAALTSLAADDKRIRLAPGFVPPEHVQLYFNAADVAVLPYRQITTSGAALLAFSFGVPVIAPALGAFPNLLADGLGQRGLIFNPSAPDALAHALSLARRTDWTGTREEIMTWVRQFDWGEIGKKLLAAYEA